jgi:hypothetical protein
MFGNGGPAAETVINANSDDDVGDVRRENSAAE